ncbi:MAG: site-specific integrase [Peptococcaceae bacterium]|jgi:site-specific recombinase XerD|nr:site-specific integrase [Peptococcaceae bacterium]
MQSDPVVQGFAEFLAEDGKRPKTIQSYTGDVVGFLAHLRRMGAEVGQEIKRFHVTSYRNCLVEVGHKASTVNKKINSLMDFNRYLMVLGLTPETMVDLRKDRVIMGTVIPYQRAKLQVSVPIWGPYLITVPIRECSICMRFPTS